MESKLIFYPVVVQIILTFAMYTRLTVVKHRALDSAEVDLERRALHSDAWPDSVLKVSNNLQNQFESPVLFYTLCFMLWALSAVDAVALFFAWAFVALRIVHAVIHTGQNVVAVRKKVFMLSTFLLVCICGFVVKALLLTH